MPISREAEIYGMALWVEKHQANGRGYIEQQIDRLKAAGEPDGVKLWRQVLDRYERLRRPLIPIDGQPETLNN